jgi:hypothetical protein
VHVFPSTWEAKIEGSRFQAQLRQKFARSDLNGKKLGVIPAIAGSIK